MEKISSKQEIIRPSKVEVRDNVLSITISGEVRSFDIRKISDRLANATSLVRGHFIVSPSGYGIHWPDIDEDISIPALWKG